MSIAETAMVLNLQIGRWTGHKLDKDATKAITQANNANDDAARVNKHLVPKDALKDITSVATRVRQHFYDHTLPWKDNGDRLLTRTMYLKFIEEHEDLVGEYKTAVRHFVDIDYPRSIEQASFRMGALFKPEDYPRPEEIARKFYINMDIDAVTEAGDFRVGLDKHDVERVQEQMATAIQARLNSAMSDVWGRLLEVVEHFANRMADKDAVFRNTTLTNLVEIVDLLPGLNVTADENLEHMRQQVMRKLTGYDAKDLRKDESVREAAATEAQEIVERMRGFMTAFGNN